MFFLFVAVLSFAAMVLVVAAAVAVVVTTADTSLHFADEILVA